jgi:hypothetical protein
MISRSHPPTGTVSSHGDAGRWRVGPADGKVEVFDPLITSLYC